MTARRRAASKSRRCTARVCMAVSNTRTPARPAVLAAYMAMSASRGGRSGPSSPPRAGRTPTLARASTSRPDTVTGVRRMAASRSPRATASPSSATRGTSTANSSPPRRGAVEGAERLLQPPREGGPVGQPGERVDAGPPGHLGGQVGPFQGQGHLGPEGLEGGPGLLGDQVQVAGQLGRGVEAEQLGGGLGGDPVDGGGVGRGQQGRPRRGQQPLTAGGAPPRWELPPHVRSSWAENALSGSSAAGAAAVGGVGGAQPVSAAASGATDQV